MTMSVILDITGEPEWTQESLCSFIKDPNKIKLNKIVMSFDQYKDLGFWYARSAGCPQVLGVIVEYSSGGERDIRIK